MITKSLSYIKYFIFLCLYETRELEKGNEAERGIRLNHLSKPYTQKLLRLSLFICSGWRIIPEWRWAVWMALGFWHPQNSGLGTYLLSDLSFSCIIRNHAPLLDFELLDRGSYFWYKHWVVAGELIFKHLFVSFRKGIRA